MLFHSPEYLLLLGCCIAAVWALPHRVRWVFLLAASYAFYGYWRLEFVGLLLVSTAIDFGCGLGMAALPDGPRRKALLGLSLVGNLGILTYFKYRLFLGAAFGVMDPVTATGIWRASDFVLPAGLSFYTLQSMGYSIDIYRRSLRPERHAGYFALYVAFFPQLIAGPIERAGALIPQLRADRRFDWDNLRRGGLLFLFGLFKKLAVADNLSPAIARLYGDPSSVPWSEAVFLVAISLIYILMDFSAYTDMARGASRMLGVELTVNFRLPLASGTIREFWKRWHISLSRWIFDYLYQPLARHSRHTAWRMLALLVTFTAIGLWHGPAWTFVLFGVFHGTLAVAETLLARQGLTWPRGRGWTVLRVARTYGLVSLSTILFLGGDLATAEAVLRQILNLGGDASLASGSALEARFAIGFVGALLAGAIHWLQEQRSIENMILRWPTAARWSVYYGLLFGAVILGTQEGQAFVYFQF